MPYPLWVRRIKSSSLRKVTYTRESSSFNLIAAIPQFFLPLSYSDIFVFFIIPDLVTKTTYSAEVFLYREVIADTDSFVSILMIELILTPLEAFVPTGTISTNNLYIFPWLVNNIKVSIVLVEIVPRGISSLLTPLPFLFCTLNAAVGILLIYPSFVIMTTQSSGVTVSISLSSLGISIWASSVRLLSPYFLTSSERSLFNSSFCKVSSDKNFKILSISLCKSLLSWFNSIFSRPANLPNFISTIALAWASVNLYLDIRDFWAAAALSLLLIKAIILSISSKAFNKPSTISSLSFALFKSYWLDLIRQLILCLT